MEHKKVIIFDKDETLLGHFNREDGTYCNIVRPGIDKLIDTLKQAKSQGIDIVLYTSAKLSEEELIEQFNKPELTDLFDRIITRDTPVKMPEILQKYMDSDNKGPDIRILESAKEAKQITTLGYDQILFIDESFGENRSAISLEIIEKQKQDLTCFIPKSFYPNTDIKSPYIYAAMKDIECEKILHQIILQKDKIYTCDKICEEIKAFSIKNFEPGIVSNLDATYVDIERIKEDINKINSIPELSNKGFSDIDTEVKIIFKQEKQEKEENGGLYNKGFKELIKDSKLKNYKKYNRILPEETHDNYVSATISLRILAIAQDYPQDIIDATILNPDFINDLCPEMYKERPELIITAVEQAPSIERAVEMIGLFPESFKESHREELEAATIKAGTIEKDDLKLDKETMDLINKELENSQKQDRPEVRELEQ